MNVKKVRAGIKALLSALNTNFDWMLIPSRSGTVRRMLSIHYTSFAAEFSKFYPSSIYQGMNSLRRKGLVELRETPKGTEVRITSEGQTQILRHQLGDLQIKVQKKWDGKWRLVFFDVEELNRVKRDRLRELFIKLGFKPLQRSVYVHPYPCDQEIAFLREVIGVPHAVKLVTAEKIENDDDLRVVFGID
ncbi:MAG: PaaX family transcriptional regulator, phenylacetic acid degradation operon negative regulatory protein [Parcubacteria group bacterium GW2011_GWC1_43_11]|nr:MAG: PaaX family transcriptional regulator, phenylacetic acid degradation operon negative regulatory protein [Parcubacteria group bacterium GW2011_GWC1_43_11]